MKIDWSTHELVCTERNAEGRECGDTLLLWDEERPDHTESYVCPSCEGFLPCTIRIADANSWAEPFDDGPDRAA